MNLGHTCDHKHNIPKWVTFLEPGWSQAADTNWPVRSFDFWSQFRLMVSILLRENAQLAYYEGGLSVVMEAVYSYWLVIDAYLKLACSSREGP